jgi:DNA/RNA-binding domain of Phe-tRNA-synthetase-like protein
VKKKSLQRDQTRNDQKEIFFLSHFAQATNTAENFSDKNFFRAWKIIFWTAEKISA